MILAIQTIIKVEANDMLTLWFNMLFVVIVLV
jgi:hypothetical protein